MNRSYLFLLVALLGVGLVLTGCGGKKTAGSGTSVEEAGAALAPNLEPAEWSYDQAPTPAIQGTPDYRMVSFGFDRESVLMKKEL